MALLDDVVQILRLIDLDLMWRDNGLQRVIHGGQADIVRTALVHRAGLRRPV